MSTIFEMDQEEIKALRAENKILYTQLRWQDALTYEYWNALYQIRSFADIWRRGRITQIRKQLSKVGVELEL